MKNKINEMLESIVYVFLIILVIFASVYGSIYIRLIPLLFILGIVGNAIFKRQIITTALGFVISLCINYLKTPTDLMYVLFVSATMSLNVIVGEAFGKYLLKLLSGIKDKERCKDKKILKPTFVLIVTLVIALLIHNITNGSIITYQECKKELNQYLKKNYGSTDTFKEINVNYYMYKNPRYIFYLSNANQNDVYKFTVYVNENDMIIDEYKDSVTSSKVNEINKVLTDCIINLDDSSKYDKLFIKPKIVEDDKISLEISKSVSCIDKITTETFAKEVVSYLEDIKKSSVYEEIEQVELSLKCTGNLSDSLISIIFIDDYDLAIEEKSDISYKYILKSFNMEYDY